MRAQKSREAAVRSATDFTRFKVQSLHTSLATQLHKHVAPRKLNAFSLTTLIGNGRSSWPEFPQQHGGL